MAAGKQSELGQRRMLDIAGDGKELVAAVFEPAVQSAAVLTPSDSAADNVAPGRQFAVVCTGPGNVRVVYPDASTHTFPVVVGYSRFPDAVVRVSSTGTTAAGTFSNLK
jgi:hypothetical protein